MKTATIIGGAGYTGGELLRLLLQHPKVTVVSVTSRSQAGKPITSVHADLLGETDLPFTEAGVLTADIVFLCLGHGQSATWMADHEVPASTRVIDLSQDFRLGPQGAGRSWVYGLPELNREAIQQAQSLANPGCFATALQLALLPLAATQQLKSAVSITAITGATGAGVSQSATSHFPWRHANLSAYKVFEHQHLKEINRSLQQLDADANAPLHFIPMRGDFPRGIFATLHTPFAGTEAEAYDLYEGYYAAAPFTVVSRQNIHLKQVVNTNKAAIHLQKHGDQLVILSCIDNLLKGAAGQAVQNLNLMEGWEETTGLRLKSTVF